MRTLRRRNCMNKSKSIVPIKPIKKKTLGIPALKKNRTRRGGAAAETTVAVGDVDDVDEKIKKLVEGPNKENNFTVIQKGDKYYLVQLDPQGACTKILTKAYGEKLVPHVGKTYEEAIKGAGSPEYMTKPQGTASPLVETSAKREGNEPPEHAAAKREGNGSAVASPNPNQGLIVETNAAATKATESAKAVAEATQPDKERAIAAANTASVAANVAAKKARKEAENTPSDKDLLISAADAAEKAAKDAEKAANDAGTSLNAK